MKGGFYTLFLLSTWFGATMHVRPKLLLMDACYLLDARQGHDATKVKKKALSIVLPDDFKFPSDWFWPTIFRKVILD